MAISFSDIDTAALSSAERVFIAFQLLESVADNAEIADWPLEMINSFKEDLLAYNRGEINAHSWEEVRKKFRSEWM